MVRYAFFLLALFSILSVFCFACNGDDDDDNDASPGDDDEQADDDQTTDDDNVVDDDIIDDDSQVCDCLIDGTCYADGETNPDNLCLICDSKQSASEWSFNDGKPCNDGEFCNGSDECSQGNCTVHAGDPCVDDGLYCNGTESCDEPSVSCSHSGNPCSGDLPWCNEESDACQTVDCFVIAQDSIGVCDTTLADINGKLVDNQELEDWCEQSEDLFAADYEVVSPFWSCWADCIYVEDCDQDCFQDCLNPVDPGSGCQHAAHLIYACDMPYAFPDEPDFYIPEMDLAATCENDDPVWECRESYSEIATCSAPPTPDEQKLLSRLLYRCVEQPAVTFNGEDQWGYIPYDESMDAQEFTLQFWVYLNELPQDEAALISRMHYTEAQSYGWQVQVDDTGYLSIVYAPVGFFGGAMYTFDQYLAVGRWTHISFYWFDQEVSLFMDFRPVGTLPLYSDEIAYDDTGVYLARLGEMTPYYEPFNGSIDYVIYSTAELPLWQYQAQADENTIGLWEMDEGAGTDIYDLSANGNDGELTDSDLWVMRDSYWQWNKVNTANIRASEAGEDARLAEEMHYQNSGDDDSTYADNLTDLLVWDEHLTDDPLVTFTFGTCNYSGYTFTTRHTNGDLDFFFTE